MSRPSKQQKMSEDSSEELVPDILPIGVISDHVLPFVDRTTWDNLAVANREIYEASKNLEAPWPMGELRGVGYEGDDITYVCFSPDGNYLCALSQNASVGLTRIRMWNKVVGSCGYFESDFDDADDHDLSAWRVYFSPVENLLVSLYDDENSDSNMVRLWEVQPEGLVFKFELQLDEEEDINGCTFSPDGRQLIIYNTPNTMRIFSVSDASLIKVTRLIYDMEMIDFIGMTTDGRKVACIDGDGGCKAVHLWDINGDSSAFEEILLPGDDDAISKIAFSPLDNSIAILTTERRIKLVRCGVRDVTWTLEDVADGKRFDADNLSFSASGQLLATVRVDEGVEIWDAIKGARLRTIVCDYEEQSMLEFSPDGNLLAVTSSGNRLSIYTI
jgi:WD40 repeat protein